MDGFACDKLRNFTEKGGKIPTRQNVYEYSLIPVFRVGAIYVLSVFINFLIRSSKIGISFVMLERWSLGNAEVLSF